MNANDLLFWISARCSGSWQQFRSAVEELHLAFQAEQGPAEIESGRETIPLYRRLQLNFERLAHVEFFSSNREMDWRVAPPVIALRRINGTWTGILCGARLPDLIKDLTAALPAGSVEHVTLQDAPDLIRISSTELRSIEGAATQTGIHVQMEASRAIIAALPAIDDPRLLVPKELPVGSGWEVSRFSASELSWKESTKNEAKVVTLGLFRFRHRYQREYVFCRSGKVFAVPLQSAKYLLLRQRRRRRGILRYDPPSQSLSVNAICHPPELIYRSLVLCSGRLPVYEPRTGELCYREVNRDVASGAASLLGQEIA